MAYARRGGDYSGGRKFRTMKRPYREAVRLAVVAAIISGSWLVAPAGCSDTSKVSDAAITAAVSVATSTALKSAIKDPAKRTQIANYIEGPYANAIRSISGNPTPDNFVQQLNAFIPANIQEQYPELVAFVNPISLWAYQQAYNKYGSDVAKISQYLNDVASGMQSGAATFATH